METLAKRIEREIQGEWKHCAVYEDDLQRIWPIDEEGREEKIAQFAMEYGFRLRFYRKGMCAIFDKWPPAGAEVDVMRLFPRTANDFESREAPAGSFPSPRRGASRGRNSSRRQF